MSDLSFAHCKLCGNPEYACGCDEPDLVAPAIRNVLKGERIPDDHPFRKNRERAGLPMYGDKPK